MRDLESGAQLASRYTLVRKLGAGGGAETWQANDRLTRASVALKVLVDDTIAAETLRREWQLSIRLMHAHIVRVFEFHDEPDGAFYTLQFLDGPDIGALAAAPPADIMAPVALVADALAYAHGKGVIHRDIKASNVMLDANGAPYLIDFGVAATRSSHIGGGSLIAASPQQLEGQEPAPSDDIFALGGLIYELVSGAPAYSSTDTASDISERVPEPLVAADGSSVPTAIRQLIADMLHKDAAQRPTAAAVVESLQRAGVQPGPASQHYVGVVREVRDQVIESETAVRSGPASRESAAAPVDVDSGGLSVRAVGIGFAALVVVLLGVIFLLPKTVTDDTDDPVAGEELAAENADAADGEAKAEEDLPQRDERVRVREDAERILGQLLANVRTLEARAVPRWGGLPWRRGEDAYKAGDAAYLARDYEMASARYEEAIQLIEPLLEQVDAVFDRTLVDAERALQNGNTLDAVRFFELAVAISPSHARARAGLVRAQNLDTVIALTEQGLAQERDLELDAALASFAQAIDIDPQWEAAHAGLARVRQTTNQMQFDLRMTEGLTALEQGEYLAARAAFRMAQELQPGSPEPADGLMQVDQGIRLGNISALEREAVSFESGERWQAAADSYERILELDGALTFAQDGLSRSRRMTALHTQLDEYINNPDSLSSPRNMQIATGLVVDITRMPEIGPRLMSQRDELSRLLKRAATPLVVQIVSDNMTDVSIYKVGKLGSFESTEVSLRPGTYVAVGSRPGYRDVRLEFRVAPELESQPVVVRCEERI